MHVHKYGIRLEEHNINEEIKKRGKIKQYYNTGEEKETTVIWTCLQAGGRSG